MSKKKLRAYVVAVLASGLIFLSFTVADEKPEIFVQTGGSGVESMDISQDGKYLLTGGYDIKLWDVGTAREIRKFKNKSSINFLSFLSGDREFFSLDSSGNLCVWEVDTGSLIKKTNVRQGIGSIGDISYDGNYLRFISGDLAIVDVVQGTIVKTIKPPKGSPAAAYLNFGFGHKNAVAPDGKLVLSSASDSSESSSEDKHNLLLLWDPLTGKIIHKLKGHRDYIRVIAISPDGKRVLSGGDDKMLKYWDLKKGKEITTFKGHHNAIHEIAFSPDGRYALSGDANHDSTFGGMPITSSVAKLWDLKKKKNLCSFGQKAQVDSVKFSHDGMFAIAAFNGGDITIWDRVNGEEVRELKRNATSIVEMDLSPDGKYMVSSSYGGQLSYWDIGTGRMIRRLPGHKGVVLSLCFSSDGRYLVSGGTDAKIKVWDLATGESIKTFSGHTGRINGLTFSPDGKSVLSYSADKSVRLWDIAEGAEMESFGMPDTIKSAGFSADGQSIIVAFDGKRKTCIKVFDRSGKDSAFYKDVFLADWSRDGRYFVAERYEKQKSAENIIFDSTEKKKISGKSRDHILVDIAGGDELGTFKGSGCVVYISVAIDRDLMLTRSFFDEESSLLEASTGKLIRKIPVKFGLLTPDGTKIVSPFDKTLKLFDVETGSELKRFDGSSSGKISSFGLSAKGGYAITGDSAGEIQFWDVSSTKLIKRITGYKDKKTWSPEIERKTLEGMSDERRAEYLRRHTVISVSFSPDNKCAASLGSYGILKIWDLKSGNEVAVLKPGYGGRLINDFSAGKYIDYGRGNLVFSPDGKYLAKGRCLYESSTGREKLKFESPPFAGGYLAFSPDGDRLISNGNVWDVSTGKHIQGYGLDESVISLYSPDGKYIFSGGANGRQNGSSYITKIESGKIVRKWNNSMNPQAFDLSSDKKMMLVSDANNPELSLWDINSCKKLKTIVTGERSRDVFLSTGNRYAVVNSGVSATIWSISDGIEIARFVSFSDGEWVVITPEGYFNASQNGAKYLNVRIGNRVYAIDNFYEKFYNPVYVASVLQGEKITAVADIRKGFEVPPDLKIVSPKPNATFSKDTISIKIMAKDAGGGVDEIRLYHNGKVVGDDRRGLKISKKRDEITKIYTVTLVDGQNKFSAVGFSRDRTESNPCKLTVNLSAPAKDVSLYVFAVGINKYKNSALNLNYAEPDAKGIVDFFKQSGEGLFKAVKVIDVYNDQATKQVIISKLKELQNTRPQDVVLIYFAGHGESLGDKWYFIPYEVTFPEREEDIKAKGISSEELSGYIKDIKAQKILMLIDACKSGAMMIAFRGFEDRKALSQLSRSTGVHIIAASTKDQFAAEVKDLGHGVFTHTLLEGLKGNASGAGEPVTVLKLMGYVGEQLPELTKKYRQETQYPVMDSRGMDFPLVIFEK